MLSQPASQLVGTDTVCLPADGCTWLHMRAIPLAGGGTDPTDPAGARCRRPSAPAGTCCPPAQQPRVTAPPPLQSAGEAKSVLAMMQHIRAEGGTCKAGMHGSRRGQPAGRTRDCIVLREAQLCDGRARRLGRAVPFWLWRVTYEEFPPLQHEKGRALWSVQGKHKPGRSPEHKRSRTCLPQNSQHRQRLPAGRRHRQRRNPGLRPHERRRRCPLQQ